MTNEETQPVCDLVLSRPIILVGLMGAGKSSIGRRLAARLDLPFVDSDSEIEAAAGYSIPDIFARFGEASFRDGEHKVMLRLLGGPVQVIATGGGAFMDERTRQAVKQQGTSIWLKAELDVLLKRCMRRNNRPLLQQGDPAEILQGLMDKRYPVYAEADITVDSEDGPHETVVNRILEELRDAVAKGQA